MTSRPAGGTFPVPGRPRRPKGGLPQVAGSLPRRRGGPVPASLALAQSPPPRRLRPAQRTRRGPGRQRRRHPARPAGQLLHRLPSSVASTAPTSINIASDTRSSADANFQFNVRVGVRPRQAAPPVHLASSPTCSIPTRVSNFQEFRPVHSGWSGPSAPWSSPWPTPTTASPTANNLDTNAGLGQGDAEDDAVLLKSEEAPSLALRHGRLRLMTSTTGWYFEFGVSQTSRIEGTGLVITALANSPISPSTRPSPGRRGGGHGLSTTTSLGSSGATA